jgi:hypothetical protein
MSLLILLTVVPLALLGLSLVGVHHYGMSFLVVGVACLFVYFFSLILYFLSIKEIGVTHERLMQKTLIERIK